MEYMQIVQCDNKFSVVSELTGNTGNVLEAEP